MYYWYLPGEKAKAETLFAEFAPVLDFYPAYADLRGTVAVYPGRMDACTVDGEVVRAQEGAFYGGWVTDDVVGPFKGGPGTHGW